MTKKELEKEIEMLKVRVVMLEEDIRNSQYWTRHWTRRIYFHNYYGTDSYPRYGTFYKVTC